jgi:hypothetical protein
MNLEQLLKFMDFMMKVLENMEMPMFGNISLTFLIIFP